MKSRPNSLLELEQGEIDLHLEDDHLPGQVLLRVRAEPEVHALAEEEIQSPFGPLVGDLLGHLGQPESVEALPGDPEIAQEIRLRDLVPHLHGAGPDGAVNGAPEHRP